MPISSLNEPPFFLYCNHCRWDSAEVGITFEKPTGLAGEADLTFPRSALNVTELSTIAEIRRFRARFIGVRALEGAF